MTDRTEPRRRRDRRAGDRRPAGEDLRPARRPAPSPRHRRLGHRARRRRTRRDRLTLGSTFGMSMKVGITYSMENTVVEFEENRRIAWQPRGRGEARRHRSAGGSGATSSSRSTAARSSARAGTSPGDSTKALIRPGADEDRASRWSRRSRASRSSSPSPTDRCMRFATRPSWAEPPIWPSARALPTCADCRTTAPSSSRSCPRRRISRSTFPVRSTSR